MLDRREFIVSTAALAMAGSGALAATARVATPQYRYILFFNFRDTAAAEQVDAALADIRAWATPDRVCGSFAGKSFLPKLAIAPFQWAAVLDFTTAAQGRAFAKSQGRQGPFGPAFLAMVDTSAAFALQQPLPAAISAADGVGEREIGFFNFKPGTTAATRKAVLNNLRDQGKLPMMKRLTVGSNALPASAAAPHRWLFISEFATVEDGRDYRKTPEHEESERIFGAANTDLAVVGFKP